MTKDFKEELDEFSSKFTGNNIKIYNKPKEQRLTLYHMVVHGLAYMLTASYIIFILFDRNIPESFSTIISIVIGFYFAKALFNKME